MNKWIQKEEKERGEAKNIHTEKKGERDERDEQPQRT